MHIIRHASEPKWLTLYGWKPQRDAALQFRTEEEAREYASTVPSLHGQWTAERAVDLDTKPAPGVVSDYDPFGYNRRAG